MDKNIKIKIFSISKGLEEKTGIKIIRIKSKYYNLLIMVDYLPIVGEIEGNIDFELATDSFSYKNIKGYFIHSNNIFNLIIKEV
ncbi:MAG: hypothetical protein PHX04_03140 [Bacilli bacterium]|nr:hypothetical protein [Bacilli bacterium]